MLQSKYNKYRFYCHNFGNYDVYFIFNSLSLDDFKNMYYRQQNVIAIKNDSKTYYDKGSVVISTKTVNLNHDVYKKRQKIFNKEGLWVDTKPLNIKP